MKPAAFDYLRPGSLEEALAALARHGADARPLAGGQSLVPMLNLRLARPAVIIDLSATAELLGAQQDSEFLTLGARTTHACLEDDGVPDFAQGYLRHVAGGIAYRAIRNRGTLGGSLSHADPSADWPTAMLAADARLVVRNSNAQRVVAAQDFFQGPFSTALAEDEIVTAVRAPRRSGNVRWAYVKQARKVGEFAQSIAAVMIDRDNGFARVALGGIAGVPWLLPQVAADLLHSDARETAERFSTAAVQSMLARETPADDAVRLRIHAATLSRAIRSVA